MKTTIELPEHLFVEAKAVAARRRITLKTLFTRAVERELRPTPPPTDGPHFELDAQGWPILKRQPGNALVVTDDCVNALRASEGI